MLIGRDGVTSKSSKYNFHSKQTKRRYVSGLHSAYKIQLDNFLIDGNVSIHPLTAGKHTHIHFVSVLSVVYS